MVSSGEASIEYGSGGRYPRFFSKMDGKTVAVLSDLNTHPLALPLEAELGRRGVRVKEVLFDDSDLLPREGECAFALEQSRGCDYVLAVGSGTLNDMAKSVATRLGIPSGVMATAASMDGYLSKGAALMRNGFKVTDPVNAPSDVLLDPDIIRRAPRDMTAAGFGDIVGKYTCLADWQLAHLLRNEEIHEGAYERMLQARDTCMDAYPGLVEGKGEAVDRLMRALLAAGQAMAMCGNSRPASGSEHHMSHFLEMDFARRGERIPMHGFKVGVGTLVSLEIYRYIRSHDLDLPYKAGIDGIAAGLPEAEQVRAWLKGMGCPVRFSEMGVRKETMEEMLEKAYTVRDRYTVLTLAHEFGLTAQMKPLLMERYW